MKLIKRLERPAIDLTDAIFGWDIFWAGDYSKIDESDKKNFDIDNLKIPRGVSLVFAVNSKKVRFLKRLFIRLT